MMTLEAIAAKPISELNENYRLICHNLNFVKKKRIEFFADFALHCKQIFLQ